jgi:hypothetical protein
MEATPVIGTFLLVKAAGTPVSIPYTPSLHTGYVRTIPNHCDDFLQGTFQRVFVRQIQEQLCSYIRIKPYINRRFHNWISLPTATTIFNSKRRYIEYTKYRRMSGLGG